MFSISVQAVTLIEAVLLLTVNGLGLVLTVLAWSVSNVDVREAKRWEPPAERAAERTRLRHNRGVVTEDARFGETCRFLVHMLIAFGQGLAWIVTPQPVNPDVVWWAVLIRASAIAISLILIAKTTHHLVARWRFDRPRSTANPIVAMWPALVLAWRDMRARSEGAP